MKENIEIINEMYEEIADELNVSDAVLDKAEKSYKELGEYLGNHLGDYEIIFFPQGSMNLGTLTKPIDDNDDYDLDAVCKVNHNFESPEDLKNLIGDTLKQSDRYSKLLIEEGKRCWTLKYSDESNFHMDILPSMPNNPQDKSIKITHKENDNYKYLISNPEAYSEWFEALQKTERIRLFESQHLQYSCKIEDLRKHGIRTTLQKTVQILKRHRDLKYKNLSEKEKENKPISVIITTLVGKMYTGKETIVDLITKFCCSFEDYVEKDKNGNYIITNPVNEKENFADKWILYPERKDAFFNWVKDLKEDLITNNFMIFEDITDKANHLKKILGEATISKVFEKRAKIKEKKYIDRKEIATLTTKKTDTEVKEHTFFGK